jgi:hypothetical protein
LAKIIFLYSLETYRLLVTGPLHWNILCHRKLEQATEDFGVALKVSPWDFEQTFFNLDNALVSTPCKRDSGGEATDQKDDIYEIEGFIPPDYGL